MNSITLFEGFFTYLSDSFVNQSCFKFLFKNADLETLLPKEIDLWIELTRIYDMDFFLKKRILDKDSFSDYHYVLFLESILCLYRFNDEYREAFRVIEDKNAFIRKYKLLEEANRDDNQELLFFLFKYLSEPTSKDFYLLLYIEFPTLELEHVEECFYNVTTFKDLDNESFCFITNEYAEWSEEMGIEKYNFMLGRGLSLDLLSKNSHTIIFSETKETLEFLHKRGVNFSVRCLEKLRECDGEEEQRKADFLETIVKKSALKIQLTITDCLYKPGGFGYLKSKEHFEYLTRK